MPSSRDETVLHAPAGGGTGFRGLADVTAVRDEHALDGPFLPVLELEAAGLDAAGDAISALFDRRALALRVRGLLPGTLLARLVEALERAPTDALAEHAFSTRFAAHSRGLILDHCGTDLAPYFAEAIALRAFLAEHAPALEPAALGALARLSGRPVEVPRATAGPSYAPLTLRRYPEGGLVPPHAEREQLGKPSYAELGARLDRATLLSFLMPLALPEAGGDLVVYEVGPDDAAAEQIYRVRGQRLDQPLTGSRAVRLEAAVGDLLLFDGGRHFHQVLPVRGARNRWTAGGFVGQSRDLRRVYAWS